MERAVVDLPLETLARMGYAPLLKEVELLSMYILRWDRGTSLQIIRCRPLRPDVTFETLLRTPLIVSGRLLRTEGDVWTALVALRAAPALRVLFRPYGDLFLDQIIEARKGRLRLSLVGDGKRLRALMAAAREAGFDYGEVRFQRAEADPRHPLRGLTPRQQQVLRAAVEMGYFENPKLVRLHDLGSLLDMDKSTVSETLRRAEKRVFETLLGT